ncbi:MAG: carbon starvation protein A [Bacteroidales bacterium]|nr:carbon starvation protein A [Candidatus Cryptobacteroides aphodequi]
MYSFIICLIALIVGYFVYGRIVDRIFGPDPARQTPAIANADGVDFVPMPAWKVYMVQFLNIAGTGPIFGAIMGAKFGPACYLWIVFGSIFAGAVHDYLCGMISIRSSGLGVPNLVGHYLGPIPRRVMLVFSLVLLLLVGTVFVYSPALILGDIAGFAGSDKASTMAWVFIIFAYYIVATLLPVDKVIGRIYPIFAAALLFMAAGLCVCLFAKWPSIPEFWDGLANRGPSVGVQGQPIFPCLFITVACGAISGFHATQSPIMARCVKSESMGRPIFYGAMITEGIVALIWAAVSSYFFFDGGQAAVGATGSQAPEVVTSVSRAWLGVLGGILAVLGVVAAPITSGDTAFRSARLIISDFLHLNQSGYKKRLLIAVPLFVAASLLLWFSIADENGFNIIWRYFGFANQALACFVLWTTVEFFLQKGKRKGVIMTLIPAAFMTAVCVTYICIDKIGFRMPVTAVPWLALGSLALDGLIFWLLVRRAKREVARNAQ